MIIKIFWKEDVTKKLFTSVQNSIEDLWLTDFIPLEKVTKDDELKKELGIKKEPALIIEEESIDFKDVIFEWVTLSDEEIKSMLISIVGWWESWGWSCWTDGSCWTCSAC